jgi:hypothetical protein
MIGGLVANSGGNIRSVIADGAYDGAPAYEAIRAARPKGSPPKIIIPPGKPSIPAKGEPHGGTERERHAAEIAARGRMAWQRRHGYGPSDRWLRRPYPGSNGSMAGGWLPELSAASGTRSHFTIQDRQQRHDHRKARERTSPLITLKKSATRRNASLHQSRSASCD